MKILFFTAILFSFLLFGGEPVATRQEYELLKSTEAMKPKEAAAVLEEASAKTPSAVLCFAAGGAHARNNDNAAALSSFLKAVELMPEFHRARLNAVKLFMLGGAWEKAVPQLAFLISSGGNDEAGNLWNLLAQCHLQMKNYMEAETAARNASALSTGGEKEKLLLLQCLAAQPAKAEEAAALAMQMLENKTDTQQLWQLLAASYADKNPKRALVMLETARRFNSATPGMLSALVQLYMEQGLWRQAAGAAREIHSSNPLDDKILEVLVNGLQQAGYLKESAELLNMLPEDVPVFKRGRLRQALMEGNTEQADSIVDTLLENEPLDGEVLLLAAAYRNNSGDYAAALHLLSIAEVLPDFKYRALLESAKLSSAAGDFAAALTFALKARDVKFSPELEDYINQLSKVGNKTN